MEQTNQTSAIAVPTTGRKAWVKPELSKLDVEGGSTLSDIESIDYNPGTIKS